jgi:hypothetical protein
MCLGVKGLSTVSDFDSNLAVLITVRSSFVVPMVTDNSLLGNNVCAFGPHNTACCWCVSAKPWTLPQLFRTVSSILVTHESSVLLTTHLSEIRWHSIRMDSDTGWKLFC